MFGELRGRYEYDGQVVADGLSALRHAQALGHQNPLVLGYHPVARTNPYQQLLYSHAWEHGIAPVPALRRCGVGELLELRALGAEVGWHLHWTSDITREAATPEQACQAVRAVLAEIDRFRAGGGRFIWSVHNRLPHDCRFPDVEVSLRRGLAERADVIHVLARDTVTAVADLYRLPIDRVVVVAHPSYVGCYADVVTRAEARWEMRIAPDELAYALVGSLQPYKGVDRALAAFDRVRRRPGNARMQGGVRRRLLVAGQPQRTDAALERALAACVADPDVILRTATLPALDVQRWLRASDVGLLTHRDCLNSGVLMLALSFGVPVVAPDVPVVRELVDERCARTFPPDDNDALVAAMEAAAELTDPSASAAARAVAERYPAARISAEFASRLLAALAASATAT